MPSTKTDNTLTEEQFNEFLEMAFQSTGNTKLLYAPEGFLEAIRYFSYDQRQQMINLLGLTPEELKVLEGEPK